MSLSTIYSAQLRCDGCGELTELPSCSAAAARDRAASELGWLFVSVPNPCCGTGRGRYADVCPKCDVREALAKIRAEWLEDLHRRGCGHHGFHRHYPSCGCKW